MPELLDPTADVTAPEPSPPDAPRPMEEIRAEMDALGARIRDPNTPADVRLALRLHILRVLFPEMGRHWTDEDRAKDLEVMRGIDSHRPPGHKLFDAYLTGEKA